MLSSQGKTGVAYQPMTASVLTGNEEKTAAETRTEEGTVAAEMPALPTWAGLFWEEALRPDILTDDGQEPERRIVLSGLSWERYLVLDLALGDDRPGPRFYYLDGDLEIMSTSEEHERVKTWIGEFLGDYLLEADIAAITRGQATMRLELARLGAEPDAAWCLHEEKLFPDLVLEIALTSGGIRKLDLYRRFGTPEVWFWRRGGLEIHTLRADGSGYDAVPNSRLLPGLDVDLLMRCVAIPTWREARRAFRAGLAGGKAT